MTTSRSTARAGQLQAGEPIVDGALPDLLNFATTADGVRVGDLLRDRLHAAERAETAHAARADDAQLAGDAAELAHAEEAGRLEREAARLRKAIEHADTRLAEVAEQERQRAGKAAAEDAAKLQAVGLDQLGAIDVAAAALAAKIASYAELCAAIEQANRTAAAGGCAVALLPHHAASVPDRFEQVEVTETSRGPVVTDADGNAVGASGVRHWGRIADSAPTTTRRIETRHVHGKKVRDPRSAGFVLPAVLDAGAYVLNQG